MRLPNGYRSPLTVYAVEFHDESERHAVQIAAFLDLDVAERCRTQLESEGRYPELMINILHVDSRLEDWEWGR